MSHIFKVGDRVRIVSALNHPEMLGREAVIWDLSHHYLDSWRLDVVGVGRKFPNGLFIAGRSFELEPLNPPKSEISEILAMQDLPDADCRKVVA